MAHIVSQSVYSRLIQRINLFPQGAPPSELLTRILQVMFDEQAGEVIRTASCRGISMCYYRHKMMHMDRACDAPMEICMTFNNAAYSLVRHGHAREVDVAECLDLPDKSRHLEALASKFS